MQAEARRGASRSFSPGENGKATIPFRFIDGLPRGDPVTSITPTQSLASCRSVPLVLSDHPVVIEISH